MKTWMWVVGVVVLVAALIILIGAFTYEKSCANCIGGGCTTSIFGIKLSESKTNCINPSIFQKYPMTYNNSYFSKKVIRTNGSWMVNGKPLEVLDNFKFGYDGKVISPILAYSQHYDCPKDIEGCWSKIDYYVVDEGEFYLVYSFNDAGPAFYGPFNTTQAVAKNCNSDADCVSQCSNGCVNKEWANSNPDSSECFRAWSCSCVGNRCNSA